MCGHGGYAFGSESGVLSVFAAHHQNLMAPHYKKMTLLGATMAKKRDLFINFLTKKWPPFRLKAQNGGYYMLLKASCGAGAP